MTYNELWRQIAHIYDKGEAQAIARMVYEVRYGLTLSDIYLGKDTQLSADCQAELEEIAKRLLENEPIQYILGQADFCGRLFHVEPGVLIPRPETEQLCRLIFLAHAAAITCHTSTVRSKNGSPIRTILDIGTGSGCIAITLALDIPNSHVTAWDISPVALRVAKENAERLGANVTFNEVDILNIPNTQHPTPITHHFDLIVSNPPYICHQERTAMEDHVLKHEPHTALFVPDDDPLLFYRAIARYALTALKPGGWLYFEINPLYADALKELLSMMSWHDIHIKEDEYGKLRMIQARR